MRCSVALSLSGSTRSKTFHALNLFSLSNSWSAMAFILVLVRCCSVTDLLEFSWSSLSALNYLGIRILWGFFNALMSAKESISLLIGRTIQTLGSGGSVGTDCIKLLLNILRGSNRLAWLSKAITCVCLIWRTCCSKLLWRGSWTSKVTLRAVRWLLQSWLTRVREASGGWRSKLLTVLLLSQTWISLISCTLRNASNWELFSHILFHRIGVPFESIIATLISWLSI